MALCHATDPVGAIKETRSMIADHLLAARSDRAQLVRLFRQYQNGEDDYSRLMRQRIEGEMRRLREHVYSLHVLADLSRGREPRV